MCWVLGGDFASFSGLMLFLSFGSRGLKSQFRYEYMNVESSSDESRVESVARQPEVAEATAIASRVLHAMSMLITSIRAEQAQCARQFPLSKSAYGILLAIDQRDSLSVVELADFFQDSLANLRSYLEELSRRNLVAPTRPPTRSTETEFEITNEGRSLVLGSGGPPASFVSAFEALEFSERRALLCLILRVLHGTRNKCETESARPCNTCGHCHPSMLEELVQSPTFSDHVFGLDIYEIGLLCDARSCADCMICP